MGGEGADIADGGVDRADATRCGPRGGDVEAPDSDCRSLGISARDRDRITGLRADGEFDLERTIREWVEGAEARVVGNGIDVREDRLELGVELVSRLPSETARRRLDRECARFREQR